MIVGWVTFASDAMAADRKVAVYVEGQISRAENQIISSAILSRISSNKEYTAFERNEAFINSLNKEQDYQTSGEVPESEIRGVGKRMGVDYVIVVNVVKTSDDWCFMSARLMDIVSGQILKTSNLKRKYSESDEIGNMAGNIAYRLISNKSK